jgi:hypothetical protein
MRALLLLLCLTAPLAHAATLESCSQKEKDIGGIRLCVEAERTRAANLLRETNLATQDAVNQKTKTDGRRTALRDFRATQAGHVRTRAGLCRAQADGVDRQACEADADLKQVEHLKHLAN